MRSDKFTDATNFWASHSCKALGEALEKACRERDEYKKMSSPGFRDIQAPWFVFGSLVGGILVFVVMR